MSSYLSAAISGTTKTVSYYYNRVATSEAKAKELSDKVAGYFENDAKALLEAGINPNAATRDGKTLLSYTVIHHNDVFINPLVQYGADLEAKDDTGKTALHHAVIQGTHHAVGELLQRGADVNAQTDGGMTPLHFAVRDGEADKVDTLVRNGADRTLTTESGHTVNDFQPSRDVDTYNALNNAHLTQNELDQREMNELRGK